MFRLWLSACCLCLLAGCTRYQMGGKWIGALPLPGADSCRISFYEHGAFEFVCAGPEGWVGQGNYHLSGDRMTLEYRWVAERGGVLKTPPRPLEVRLSGERNHLDVFLPNGEKLSWERRL